MKSIPLFRMLTLSAILIAGFSAKPADLENGIIASSVLEKANNGDPLACVEIGKIYYFGKNVPKDEKKAFEFMLKAAQAGNLEAMGFVGEFYCDGKGVEKSEKDSFQWIEKGANAGNAFCEDFMSYFYFNGVVVEHDEVKAYEWAKKSAEKNFPKAMLDMVYYCLEGESCLKDPAKALEWTNKALAQGEPAAMELMGVMCFNGLCGLNRDVEKAFAWHQQAAELNDYGGMCDLGWMYLHGIGVNKDPKTGVQWLRKSAENNVNTAQLYLGLAYFFGDGVDKDEQVGLEWIEKSKKSWSRSLDFKIDSRSQMALAIVYKEGLTVQKDIKKALELLLAAAELGEKEAQYEAGLILAGGRGVEADLVNSHLWMQLSGMNKAECSLDNLEKAMSPEQIEESKKLAQEWMKKQAEK